MITPDLDVSMLLTVSRRWAT